MHNLERHLRRGGLWQTYCSDLAGTPLPIRILRFDNIAADWQRLLADWHLPVVPLERVNTSGVPFRRDLVSDRIHAQIMDYCHIDCERFGYE